LITTDAKFTTRYIVNWVVISVGADHKILRRDLKIRRISARWIPHLLTKENKLARVRISNQLSKHFLKYNRWSFAYNITVALLLWAQAKDTLKNIGNQRKSKTLHSKTHNERQKSDTCNILYQSRSCYSNSKSSL
jgi:histone-lysine N-methyltransferase SETMAR